MPILPHGTITIGTAGAGIQDVNGIIVPGPVLGIHELPPLPKRLMLSNGLIEAVLLEGNGGAYASYIDLTTSMTRIFLDGDITEPFVLTGGVRGAFPVTLEGSETDYLLIVRTTNYNSGDTTIDGKVQVGFGDGGGATGALGSPGVININGTLRYNRSDNITVSNTINGPGLLEKTGTGVLTLSGNNSHNGGTTVNGGTVRPTHLNALGAGPVLVNAGATLDLTGLSATERQIVRSRVTVNAGGTLRLYEDTLLTKLKPENNTGLGSPTVLGNVLPTQAAPRTILSVINTWLITAITQTELDIILAAPVADFVMSMGCGDRRSGNLSRFAIATNWQGENISGRVVQPEIFPYAPYFYNHNLTFSRAGGTLTMTDSHSGQPNTYGSIRYFTVRRAQQITDSGGTVI